MTAVGCAWLIVALAALFLLVGAAPVALFLSGTAAAVAMLGPTPEQRDARGRNPHARRAR